MTPEEIRKHVVDTTKHVGIMHNLYMKQEYKEGDRILVTNNIKYKIGTNNNRYI